MSGTLAGAPVFVSSAKSAYVFARDVEYLAVAVFWGGLAFVSAVWPAGASVRRTRILLSVGWLAGLLASAAALATYGAWIAGRGPSAALHGELLRAALNTDTGRQWAAKLMLWALASVLLSELLNQGERVATSLPWRVGALAVGLATIRIDGLAGHASDTVHPAVAELADLVHVIAISVWLGGLAVLVIGVLPSRDVDELARIVPRYSLLAMAAVTAVIASGAVMAWRMLPNLAELTSTTWGHLLLIKLGLLVVILTAAFGSKTWVAHRLDFAVILRGDAAGRVRPFVLSVAFETVLVIGVLGVAGFLATADLGR